MNMQKRLYGNQPTLMGRGVIGTTRLNVFDAIQATDWGSLFDAGYALDVSSSSASDTNSAGTGARKITVFGLDFAGNPLSEVINLNGQTKVTGAALFWRVFAAQVTDAGSGRVNAGDIYIYKTGTGGTITAGVPGTLTGMAVKILVGENLGNSGVWTAPRGTVYILDQLNVCCRAQAGRLEAVHGASRASTVIYPYTALSLDMGIGGPAMLDYHEGQDFILEVRELEDIYFRATMAAANGIVSFIAKLQIASPVATGLYL